MGILRKCEMTDWNKSEAAKTARTQISDELIYHYKDSGYLIRIMDDAINMAINVFVKPELEAATASSWYMVEVVSWKPCSWHGSWWARFIRWMIEVRTWAPASATSTRLRRLVRRIIPNAIIWLCYARRPIIGFANRDLPSDALERITAQRYEMTRRGAEPSMVLVGRKAMFEIMTHPSITGHNYLWRDGVHRYDSKQHILGLELKESPWLSENSIVVV